ncbi:MAG TPA: hypothetical protein VGM37_21790 [Armatimonadota bacterium]
MEPFTPAEEEEPIRPDWRRTVNRLARWIVFASFGLFCLAVVAGGIDRNPIWGPMALAGFALACLGGALALSALRLMEAQVTLALAMGSAFLLLLCPSFLPYTERTPRSKSLNNLRQLAVAMMWYSQDYGETYPGWVNNGAADAPRYVHNAWDEQIHPGVKNPDVYSNGLTGIRSPSQPGPRRDRALTYGLNGLLICPPSPQFNGHAPFDGVGPRNPPAPFGPSSVPNPAATILFAELAADRPMDGVYGQPIPPDQRPRSGGSDWTGTEAYQKAQPGWIDIDPHAFCELTAPPASNYVEPYGGATGRGVARDLYGGGGCYAFCDGHVQFLKLAKTVGIGQVINGKLVTAENCWSPLNTFNMWIPL